MATGSGIIRKVSGKVGDLVYRVQNGQQVIAAYNPHVKNPQTALQMQQRTKWLNVLAMYKVMKPYLKGAFENKPSGQNDYNRFMGINLQADPVYLTRAQFVDGGAIIAPYLIAQGSLPAITLTGSTTDIVANFTDAATVAEASASILSGDARFKQGDALSFFVVAQQVSAEGTPVAQAYAMKLTLDLTDTTPLSSLCTARLGIAATDGFVSVTTNSEVYATAVVHTRRTEKLLVSSARLQVTGDIDTLLSDSTFAASANSLGYTEDDIFLEPDSTVPTTGNGSSGAGGTEDDDAGGSDTGGNDSSEEESNPL